MHTEKWLKVKLTLNSTDFRQFFRNQLTSFFMPKVQLTVLVIGQTPIISESCRVDAQVR